MKKNLSSLNKDIRNIIFTSVIASAVLLSLGTIQAFADELTDSEKAETVQQGHTVDTTKDKINSEISSPEGITVEESYLNSEIKEKDPPLLPGDFFYFVKKLIENVQLALTFDDVKKAELLAAFAGERIKEATALLAQGEEEIANEILSQAFEQQELALAKYEKSQPSVSESTATKEIVVDPEQEQPSVDPIRAALEAQFADNLVALQAVLDKVENPEAKEVLANNIVKAQEEFEKKVNKKLAKLEEEQQKADKKRAKIEAKFASGEIDEEEYNEELAENNEDLAEEKAEIIEEINENTDEAVEEALEIGKDRQKGNKENRDDEDEDEEHVPAGKEQRETVNKETEVLKKAEEERKRGEETKKQEQMEREEDKKREEKAKEEAKKAEEKQREAVKKEAEERKKAEERKQEEARKQEEKQREESEKRSKKQREQEDNNEDDEDDDEE